MREKLIITGLILIFVLLVSVYLNDLKIKNITESARKWLGFLKPNFLPSEIKLIEDNNIFSTQWNINQADFGLSIKSDGNNVTYTLIILNYSYVPLNETIVQQIFSLYSLLQPIEFRCGVAKFSVERSGIACTSVVDSKFIFLVSSTASTGEETQIHISETLKT